MSQTPQQPFPRTPARPYVYSTPCNPPKYSSQNPYTPPNPLYTPPQKKYPPTYYNNPSQETKVAAQAIRSRGNAYLLGLNTAVSNLSLHEGAPTDQAGRAWSEGRVRHHAMTGSSPGSPNRNKTLPPLPPSDNVHRQRPMSGALPHSVSVPVQLQSGQYGGASKMASSSTRQELGVPPPIPPRPISLPPTEPRPVAPQVQQVWPERQNPILSRPSVQTMTSCKESLGEKRTGLESPHRPWSDTAILSVSQTSAKGKKKPSAAINKEKENVAASTPKRRPVRKSTSDGDYSPIIDLTNVSSGSSHDSPTDNITPRSSTRRQRATSDLRQSYLVSPSLLYPSPVHRGSPTKTSGTPKGKKTSTSTPSKPATPSQTVQCSGFTRTGQPCKRLVKTSAPFLIKRTSSIGSDDADADGDLRSERVMGRYCKDHAGMICDAKGFYWRNSAGGPGMWIEFETYISKALGQQTQTLLRMTMESKLTAKETPGFLYAYELRDLETDELSFFKVGRTDNVPRRIGQWTNQCQSKTPTLLDIFPLPSSFSPSTTLSATSLRRSGTVTTSFLPGATTHRTPPLPAMKRWERLVHMELSERCAAHPTSQEAFDRVRLKCKDCGTGHKEIFPLLKTADGTRAYEIVVECVERWGRFINVICADERHGYA